MTPKEFEKLASATYHKSWDILEVKKHQYATEDDRLQNFKRAGALQDITPEKALRGMMSKHLISISDMVDDLDKDGSPDFDLWDEKLIDTINYCVLLRALLADRFRRIQEKA